MEPRNFVPRAIFLDALVLFWVLVAGLSSAEARWSIPKEVNPTVAFSTPEECARECVRGAPPKVCYYHFTMELYTTLGRACALCTPNTTDSITSNCQCVIADGVERGFLTVNRMLPGPSIFVCKGDKVVIDVKNDMDGIETTIHWHGILQKGSQYYDGVPRLTQCPIPQATTFRYQYYADNDGTHFWHAHDGTQKLDGIYGKLIVRVPKSEDPNGNLYDFDRKEHVIILSDWLHDYAIEHLPGRIISNTRQRPVSVLINGKGRYTNPITGVSTNASLEEFVVEPGQKYRFRVINSFCATCPAEFTFEGHGLILIAVDGVPVKPVNINSTNSFPGERFDFVLHASQPPGNYWIQVRALGGCAADRVHQLAILRYAGNHVRTTSAPPTYNSSLPTGVAFNPVVANCNTTDALCIDEIESARPVDRRLLRTKPDVQHYIPLSFYQYSDEQLFEPNTYERFFIPGGGTTFAARMDNISFVFPPSPPLSQYKDIPSSQYCNNTNRPADCGTPCFCTNKIDIPKNSVCEIILIDDVGNGNLNHPIHMHGFAYHVISSGRSPFKNVTKMSSSHARRLDREGYIRRRFNQPPAKDTIAVPSGGYVVIRFIADNPGYWLLHCHFLYHHIAGMEMILHVGDDRRDLPPVPPHFPTCGNHLPPVEIDRRRKFNDKQVPPQNIIIG